MATVTHTAPARDPQGRFARESDPWSVVPVLLVPRWDIAYRVGPRGRIYAERSAAVRYARHRLDYLGRPNR
jgi:hypothetical protein